MGKISRTGKKGSQTAARRPEKGSKSVTTVRSEASTRTEGVDEPGSSAGATMLWVLGSALLLVFAAAAWSSWRDTANTEGVDLVALARSGANGEAARRGEKLFEANCQACHGQRGAGESPHAGLAGQALAPALDATMHAWHHTDEQLRETILKGSPVPNSRMVGWEGRLSGRDADDLVAYMKSLWDERALRCQGPKHMNPGCGGMG